MSAGCTCCEARWSVLALAGCDSVGVSAGVPGLLMLIGGVILPDSPASLVERGHLIKARKVRWSPCSSADSMADQSYLLG